MASYTFQKALDAMTSGNMPSQLDSFIMIRYIAWIVTAIFIAQIIFIIIYFIKKLKK
jgi:hypothetical protein